MFSASTSEMIQMAIGAVMGTAVAINMDRFGMSFSDPKTRWKAAGIVVTFLFTYLILSDLIIN